MIASGGGKPEVAVVGADALAAELLQRGIAQWFPSASCRVFAGGAEALARFEEKPPVLVLVDWSMTDMEGRDFIRRTRAAGVVAPILVLAPMVDRRLATDLMALRANGCVAKGAGLRAVEEAARQLLVIRFGPTSNSRAPETPAPGAYEVELTERQRQVALAVARGLSSKEIAAQLGVSPGTVQTYRAQLLVKLRVRDRASLVRWCVEHSLV